MRTGELFKFIKERHLIYDRRSKGCKKPWTNDPILQRYRFCNVYRELDTVTNWIAKNWREPNADDPYVFFAMCIARLINWPDSLAEVGYPSKRWKPEDLYRPLEARKKRGEKVFTGAYMIHADANATGSKVRYLAERVLLPIWKDRGKFKDVIEGSLSLAVLHIALTEYRDFGSFMAAQVVADTKYVGPLRKAKDWWTWAAPGPGSMRGLGRVIEEGPDYPWESGEWFLALDDLREEIDPLIANAGMPRLHAQDLQNCLCEFDKYERVRLGEGRPRALYPGV